MTEYWVISPYHSEKLQIFKTTWEFDIEHGTIAVGWPEVNDISGKSREEIRKRLDEVYTFPNEGSLTRDANGLWSFYNEVSIGDIVIARRGTKTIIGIGRVIETAFYDERMGTDRTGKHGGAIYPHFIGVEWEEKEVQFAKITFSRHTIYKLPGGKEKFQELTGGINFDVDKRHIPSQSQIVPRFQSVKQHQMIREAAESIEGIISREFILDFIGEKYPETKLSSIKIVIKAFTVNNQNRIGSFPENKKARICDQRYDILYQPVQGKAEYELYDPVKHGEWVIARTKRTAHNPHGLKVKLTLGGAASTALKVKRVSKAGVGRHLSRAQIEALIEAFRGFMSSYEGVQDLKKRQIVEPDQVKKLLKKARAAQRKGNWKVFLPLVYYGVLPSKKRKSELGYNSPSAPSGQMDLLERLRKQAGYKEPAIREQACRIVDIMSNANSGRVKAVLRKSVDLENSQFAWGVKLGQITPSLFALDDRLMIVNKRVTESFKQMSMSVLGKALSLRTKLSNYQNAIDELMRFKSQLASSYDFHEVLDNHWLNLFFSKSAEWKFRVKKRHSSLARQMDPAKRKKIELLAMNFAIDEEKALGRKCTDVSSTESFDILSTDQMGGDPKYVEVKGHSGNDRTAWLTFNEYNLALKERDKYILYIVYNLDKGKPSHRRIVDPVTAMKVEPKETISYFLS